MNTFARHFTAATCALLLSAVPAALAGPKEYQITGPVVSINETTVVIHKGNENWEIGRDTSTKGAEALKVGDKVTVHYTMTAGSVEAKPAKTSGTPLKKEKPDAVPAAAPSSSPKA